MTLRHGPEVIARFGTDEWAAGDAVRVIQEAHFTEFCRFGSAGVVLPRAWQAADAGAVPGAHHALRLRSLRPRELSGKWCVTDVTGKPILPASSEAEANDLIRIVKAYGFDTLATVGNSATANLQFLAKSR